MIVDDVTWYVCVLCIAPSTPRGGITSSEDVKKLEARVASVEKDVQTYFTSARQEMAKQRYAYIHTRVSSLVCVC